MTVTMTSEALGKQPGQTYTGPEEAWLLAEGYASQAAYTGPGVSNTGAASTTPANDPRLAANREAEPTRHEDGTVDPGRLDPALTPGVAPDPIKPAYDFDAGSTDTEKPSAFTLEPTALPLAGGPVEATGQNFENTTGVTVGGTAATDVTVRDDSTLEFVAPAKAAGTYDVVVTDNVGSTTKTGGLTYSA